MKRVSVFALLVLILGVFSVPLVRPDDAQQKVVKAFSVYPIGYVRKAEGRTTIVLDRKYEPGLLRFEKLSDVWVLWWLDRNDTPEKRSVLQVHPGGKPDNPPYITQMLGDRKDAVVAVSDYSKTLPHSLARWIKQPFTALGTDGFGRSESRDALRDFFEVDARYIAVAALHSLSQCGKIEAAKIPAAVKELGIDPDKLNPMITHWGR